MVIVSILPPWNRLCTRLLLHGSLHAHAGACNGRADTRSTWLPWHMAVSCEPNSRREHRHARIPQRPHRLSCGVEIDLELKLKDDLLRKGYFPENMPPSFNSEGIADFFRDHPPGNFFCFSGKPVKAAIYNASKRGMTRRVFSVVHPVSAYDMAEFTSKNWNKLNEFFDKNKSSLSVPRHTPDGDRALEISSHGDLEATRLTKLSRYRFISKTDISRFYHSIYTHSIPWAFHGRVDAKQDRNPKSSKIFFNKVDKILRNGQDDQTIGIPVGPDVSRVIAETVCTAIDLKFQDRCDVDDYSVIRHVDDVWIGTNSHVDAERVLWRYREAIREYELDINESKTKIYAENFRFSDGWPTEIAAQLDFAIDSPSRRVPERLRTAFEHAFSFATDRSDDGVLRYAIRYLDQSDLQWRFWETVEPLLQRSAVHFGHTMDYVARVIVWRQLTRDDVDIEAWKSILSNILDKQGKLGNDSEVCWAVYTCIRLKIKIPTEAALNIIENCGAMSIISILNCIDLDLVDRSIFSDARDLLFSETANGPYWPVLMEWISRDWPQYGEITTGHDLIEEISKNKVVMFDVEKLPKVFEGLEEDNLNEATEAIESRISNYEAETDEGDEDRDVF